MGLMSTDGMPISTQNACRKLWDEGRKDVKYTIYLPEELEQYGIGSTGRSE